jgi:uncharacterized cupin superfamily protein
MHAMDEDNVEDRLRTVTPAPPAPVGSVAPEAPSLPVALHAADVPVRARPSLYPAPFAARVAGRAKRPLGEAFGLCNFGVNLTTLAPGAVSALRHAHALQDEFVYVLDGEVTLVTDRGATPLRAGMCAGFRAGSGDAHHLRNDGQAPATYLEVGDRTRGDRATYPDDDLVAVGTADGWVFAHKDGAPYA